MADPIAYVLLLCSVPLGAVSTGLVRVLAIRFGVVDKPNVIIPQHTHPVAHMGGIGIALATSATLCIALAAAAAGLIDRPIHPRLAAFGIATLGFALVGAVDDLLRLSASVKLLLQLPVAAVGTWCGLTYPFTNLPLLDAAISATWIIVVVNAVNVTDVCDGLVSGISFLILLLWAHFDPSSAPIALALGGACLGFLFYNFPPASIFLGDTGSHLLGAAIAALTLMRPQSVGGLLHAGQIALFAAPFLFEMTLLIVVRRRKGLPWWRGSPDHFSLRLQAAGLTRGQTDLVAWTATLACCLAAFGLEGSGPLGRMVILGSVAATAFACWRHVSGQHVEADSASLKPHSRPLRVLWIHQNLVTAHQPGNVRSIHVVAALLERGWSVEAITTQAGYLDDAPAGQCATVEREGNLTLRRLPSRGGPLHRYRGALSFFFQTLAQLRQIGEVDVVYCSTPPSSQILLAVIACVWKSAPMVLEVRDLWPAFLVRLRVVRLWPVIALLAWLESLGLRYAHTCISVSPAFSGYLKAMGYRAEQLTVIPSGADPIMSTADVAARQSLRASLGARQKLVVLYAGSFNESYAIDALLAAARLSTEARPDVVWLFAGNGRKRSEVEAAAQRSQAIQYMGTFPKDEAPRVLAGADVGVVSLADEPLLKLVLPGKLFDYMAAGLPVICNNDGLPGAVVRAAAAGVVVAGADPARLAAAVVELADRPRCQLAEIGARGQRWALEHLPSSALARSIPYTVLHAYEAGQRSPKSALRAGIGPAIDVLTMRGSRTIRSLLRTDLSEVAESSLAAWLDCEVHRRARGRSATLPIPALLSGRACRDAAATQGAGASGQKPIPNDRRN